MLGVVVGPAESDVGGPDGVGVGVAAVGLPVVADGVTDGPLSDGLGLLAEVALCGALALVGVAELLRWMIIGVPVTATM